MKEQVEKVIAEIRPLLQSDGGDIALVEVDEKTGIVKVSLRGACSHCPGAAMTLKMVVERKIKSAVPQVQQVISA